MKCLKATKEGKYSKIGDIIRISDSDAMSKVDSGYWAYIPKSEWKAETRKPVEKEEKIQKEDNNLNKNQRKEKFIKKTKKV